MTVEVSAKAATKIFREHKELAIPAIISTTLSIAFVIGFLVLSGFHAAASELADHHTAYEKSNIDITFREYLELQNYNFEGVHALFNLNNLLLASGLILIKLLISWYLGCMSWAMIARQKKHSKKTLVQTTNQYFLRYAGVHAFVVFIIYLPFMLFIIWSIYSLTILSSTALALSAITIVGVLVAAYMLAAVMRLIFTTPSLYDKNTTVKKTLTHAYHATGHHFQHVILVTLIAVALTMIAYHASQGSEQAIMSALFNTTSVVLASLAIGILALVEATIVTYERIFLYEAYADHIRME